MCSSFDKIYFINQLSYFSSFPFPLMYVHKEGHKSGSPLLGTGPSPAQKYFDSDWFYLNQVGCEKPKKDGSQHKAGVQLFSIYREMALGLSHEQN